MAHRSGQSHPSYQNQQRYPSQIIVYDGACKLCNSWVNFVLKHDHQPCFYFCAAQSKLGSAMMCHIGASSAGDPLADYDSVLLVQGWGLEHCVVYQKSDAAIAIFAKLKQPWRWLRFTRVVPKKLRDWGYDFVARNRYRWFGRHAQCQLPSTQHQARFIDA